MQHRAVSGGEHETVAVRPMRLGRVDLRNLGTGRGDSAMPIGRPGWPELAFSTASIASARMALASCLLYSTDR